MSATDPAWGSAAATGLADKGTPPPGHDACAEGEAEALFIGAVAMALAVNHANRELGLPDLKSFGLPRTVRKKMGFSHGRLRQRPDRTHEKGPRFRRPP